MNWLKRTWFRFKAWIIGLLAALGLVAVTVAQAHTLSWTHPTDRVDGTPMDISEILETRIYCGGSPIVVPAPAVAYDYLIPGSHTCYATTVDTYGQESDPSNSVTFEVLPARPSAPVLN